MVSVWCVTFATTLKNFQTKRDAVTYLRLRTNDTPMRPTVIRQGKGAYTFYGPGRGQLVLRANIDHLCFASLARRRRK